MKLSVNAYSFNRVLGDAVDFCAGQRVPALDATGYYFPGYPEAPGDDYLFELKRWAYLNGVAISGTGPCRLPRFGRPNVPVLRLKNKAFCLRVKLVNNAL